MPGAAHTGLQSSVSIQLIFLGFTEVYYTSTFFTFHCLKMLNNNSKLPRIMDFSDAKTTDGLKLG